ncbi:MAG: PaaI family thioesterase [Chloroflexi bacterium]|nr:PaaI family thioesterase [Chloroflexota bacterium]
MDFSRYPALGEMQAVPLFGLLGFRFTDADDGRVEVTLDATPASHNLYGIVHGGVWLVVADSAMGGALSTVVGAGERVLTTQAEFRWLRALEGDRLTARARVLHRGRSVSHCAVEMFDGAERLVGQGSGTYVVVVG